MATKSKRKQKNITRNIFIKTLLFCVLLSFCLYQSIHFLLLHYDKEHSKNTSEIQTVENTLSNTNSEKHKAFSRSMSEWPPSIIDIQAIYTIVGHVLQPSRDEKTKEHIQVQNGPDKKDENELPTQIEKEQAKNSALHIKNATNETNKLNNSSNLANVLEQLAPQIGLTMFAICLIGSFIYTKLIAKPFQCMNEALQEIMSLDFSDEQSLKKNEDLDLQAIASQAQNTVKNLHETNKELRNELEIAHQVEEDRKKFMSVMSHELKTPIAAVMGQLDGMIYGIGAYKDRDKYLRRSYEMMQDINKLTEKMSELSKTNNPQFNPHLEIISLSCMIEDIMNKVDYFIHVKQLKVQSNIKQDVRILADYKFIKTAIFNIISNAIHYTIDHQHIYIKLYEKSNGYVLEVLNTGAQIEEEKLAHLFEPFYRGNPSQHGLVQGSGLGLYIVKQVLDKHKFPYGIQNTPQGVKCSIVFPKLM